MNTPAFVLASMLFPFSAAAEDFKAQELFDQASTLMRNHEYEAACQKLSESQQLDPQLGTLLHLAHCLEASGRLVDAYRSFETAAKLAKRRNEAGSHEPRELVARQRADALLGRLCLVTLQLDDGEQPELKLELDGQPLDAQTWARPIPVTLGHHVLRASIPTATATETAFEVGVELRSLELRVPKPVSQRDIHRLDLSALAEASSGGAPAFLPLPTGQRAAAQSTLSRDAGFVVAGVGAAGLIAGAIIGIVELGKVADMRKLCPDLNDCDIARRPAVTDLHQDARGLAKGANWTLAISGVVLAAGLGLAVTQLTSDGAVEPARTLRAPRAAAF